PAPDLFVWDGLPEGFHHWGVTGAIDCVYHKPDIKVKYLDDPGSLALVEQGRATLLHWDQSTSALYLVRYGRQQEMTSYLTMDPAAPVTQLGVGWYKLEDNFRWTQPDAGSKLRRPQRAREFELVASVTPDEIREIGKIHLRVV